MIPLSKIMAELCPDGVGFKEFSQICQFVRGITYNKSQEAKLGEHSPQKILRANNITLFNNTLNFNDVKLVSSSVRIKKEQFLYNGDILICAGSGSKEHIGKVAYIDSDMDYSFGGFMAVIRCGEELSSRFLFHLLTGEKFKTYLDGALNSTTINNLNYGVIKDFRIPVPPREVQREIVRILDKFTELGALLETELIARKKQYEYYREKLLTFGADVPRVPLGEIGTFYGGLMGKNKDDFRDGNAKYITYMNVYSNFATNLNDGARVKVAEIEKQHAIKYGDVLFTGSSETPDECGMSSVVTQKPEEKIYLNSFCFGFRLNDIDAFCPDFLKHLFRSDDLRKQIFRTASGVTRYNVSKKRFADVKIPVPPTEVQREIARILDKFTELIAQIEAEIAARKKQYEYYRDRLLTFREKKF